MRDWFKKSNVQILAIIRDKVDFIKVLFKSKLRLRLKAFKK